MTPNFFTLLGTPPLTGRTFSVGTSPDDVAPEAILSHSLCQRRFGGDWEVVGQAITLDGERLTIVGVMPAGFTIRTTELSESRAEIWLPLRLTTGTPLGMGGFLHVVARLAPGVTFDQAQADVSLVARRIEESSPSYSRDWTVTVVPRTTRETVPQREHGARRHRRHVGGLLGVWGTQLLVSSLPAGIDLPRTREIAVDLRMLAFAVSVTLVTAVLFGVVPLAASGRTGQSALRDAARGSSAGRSRSRLGSGLLVSEVALTVILLTFRPAARHARGSRRRPEGRVNAGCKLTTSH